MQMSLFRHFICLYCSIICEDENQAFTRIKETVCSKTRTKSGIRDHISQLSNLNIAFAQKVRLFKRSTLNQKLFLLEIFFEGEKNLAKKMSK